MFFYVDSYVFCIINGARLFQSSGTPVYPVKDKQTENNQTNTENTKISAGPAALSFNVNGVSFDMIKVEAGSYSKTSQTDPIGAKSGSNRVLRGGSWDDKAVCCRVSYRGRISPDSSEGNRGFRVVMEP